MRRGDGTPSLSSSRGRQPMLFGVANSDHQCEAFYGPWPRDIRDGWEPNPRGMATDFWRAFETDVANAASLGCRIFRFSTSWARIQPDPDAVVSDDAVEHYRQVVHAIRKKNMEPLVTLLHLVWPTWIQEVGDSPLNGLLSDRFPDLFGEYVGAVAGELKEVRYWCTINEPNTLLMGFLFPAGWRIGPPPGLAEGLDPIQAVERLIPNLFLAHAKAFKVIKQIIPGAKVGANPACLGLPPEHTRRLDRKILAVTGRKSLARQVKRLSRSGQTTKRHFPMIARLVGYRATLTSALNGNWWHLGMAGALSAYLCPPDCVARQDYVGFDYYWGVDAWWRILRIIRLISALSRGQYRDAPVWPQGISKQISYLSRLFRDAPKPIMILENGCVEVADGHTRSRYIREHVAEVLKARREGADVRAYICWSISTNRELGAPSNAQSDFGLFHIDLDTDPTLTRRPTESAAAYHELITRATADS